ncbi:hypothetical protein AZ66_28960 [Paenibacillus sp. E194]|nr:hypothetical protein AZ66_28960 [Paenibacillus sp. E194]
MLFLFILIYRTEDTLEAQGKDTYIASRDYSSIQGENQWFYQEWNGKQYVDLKWNESERLWRGSHPFTMIAANVHHPDETDVARKWVAPKSGLIRINGRAAKSNPGCGDGVRIEIRKNTKLLWTTHIEYNDIDGVTTNYETHINSGEALYFIINKGEQNNYCDSTYWDPSISYLDDNTSLAYSASEGFSGVQGQNNWYYEEGKEGTLSFLNWDGKEEVWRGKNQYSLIGRSFQHPTDLSSVRTWAAPESGLIRISGKVAKGNTKCGNGIIASIQKNNEVVWSALIRFDDAEGIQVQHDITVHADDKLRFLVASNESLDCDFTSWDPRITYMEPKADLRYSSVTGFSPAQGQSNWYYQEFEDSKYEDTKWDFNEKQWRGKHPFSIITHNMQHPDKSDSVRKWVAPKSGSVRVSGHAAKSNTTCGDGVKATILNGLTLVWQAKLDYNNDDGVDHDIVLPISAGGVLYFVINANGTNLCDSTNWTISIHYDSEARSTIYSYDAGNKMETITYPDGRIIYHYYDANGNLIRREKRK